MPGGQVLRQRRQRGLLPVLPDRQPGVRRVHEARAGLLRDDSNDGKTGQVPTDRYSDFLKALCRRGCTKFGVVNWCVTGTCSITE